MSFYGRPHLSAAVAVVAAVVQLPAAQLAGFLATLAVFPLRPLGRAASLAAMGYAAVTADDIRATIAEFDQLGRDVFLDRYGYSQAARYHLVHEGRKYDSKAIVGVAHKVSNGRALTADEFSGGEQTVVRRLKQLGFEVQSTRNPDWVRDEIILACQLVVENDWHMLRPQDPRVIELSELLQRANIHPPESRATDFRNPNGVARKTADIATHHPDYDGKPTKGGRLDEEVLGEFIAKPTELISTANAIRESILEGHIQQLLIAELDLDFDAEADEGRVLERRHIARERDPKIRGKKIAAVRRATGSVACEACGFDFAKTYGARGTDFIECHHRVPLHVSGQTKTTLADLVLLCSNCHRMIHRRRPWLTFEQLIELVKVNRS